MLAQRRRCLHGQREALTERKALVPQRFVLRSEASGARSMGCSKAARKSGKDDYDKFSLPTGSGFIEDTLKAGTCRLITDAQFDCSGPKCFSCNEMKC
jgi:hypothetical protein